MILQKEFNGFEVNFEPFIKNRNVMVNATQMAKVFDKKVENFTRIESTQNFISECLNNANKRFLGVENETDLVVSTQKSGTWMHRILALKFAAWLNPAFDLWIMMTIEEILFGALTETEKSIENTVAMQNEMNLLLLKEQKTGADFERFLELRELLSTEKNNRRNITKSRFVQVYDLFNQPQPQTN